MKVEATAALAVAAACLQGALAFAPAAPATSLQRIQAAAPAQLSAPALLVRPSLLPRHGKRSIVDELNNLEGEEGDAEGEEGGEAKPAKKEKVKLEAEVTFYEGGPDISETFIPTVSILTVIGIIPFAASVARQAWVRYTITSRRVRVVSGVGGKDETEVVYPDIKRMVFVFRMFGRCGDVVLELRDGSRLELRSLGNFEENYNYIFSRTTAACQEASQKMTTKAEEA